MNKSITLVLTTAITLASGLISGCGVGSSIAQSKSQPIKENTIAILFLKRDNLTQKYRAEVFPIARYNNGRYQAASLDLTPEMRENANEAAIVKANAGRSLLKPNQTFTAYNGQTNLGAFKVAQLGVGQFACSAFLVGRTAPDQTNLKAAFEAIPRDREATNSGYMFGKEFDEAVRSTLATQTATSATMPQATNNNRYSRDILAAATSVLNRNAEARRLAGNPVIEKVQVYDLDRDGKPEVYAQVRKGQDPKTVSRSQDGKVTTAYATLWLNYKTGKPSVMTSEVVPYTYPVSRFPSEILGAIDVNGDGIAEVIRRDIGYESTSFSVLELKSNQLKSVFSGANYGC